MNARLATIFVAVVAVVAIAVGCGGGDSSSSAGGSTETTSSPEKEAFVKGANAACSKARTGDLNKVGVYEKAHRSQGLSETELSEDAFKAALLSTVEAEIAGMRKLAIPKGDEEEVEQFLSELEREASEARREEKTESLEEIEKRFATSDKELRAYELTECTKNG